MTFVSKYTCKLGLFSSQLCLIKSLVEEVKNLSLFLLAKCSTKLLSKSFGIFNPTGGDY